MARGRDYAQHYAHRSRMGPRGCRTAVVFRYDPDLVRFSSVAVHDRGRGAYHCGQRDQIIPVLKVHTIHQAIVGGRFELLAWAGHPNSVLNSVLSNIERTMDFTHLTAHFPAETVLE
jgi:hypothetical protein